MNPRAFFSAVGWVVSELIPGQFFAAMREADYARGALHDQAEGAREELVDFEAERDCLDAGELPDHPGPTPEWEPTNQRTIRFRADDPMFYRNDDGSLKPKEFFDDHGDSWTLTTDPHAASAPTKPTSEVASEGPAGDIPPSPAGHSTTFTDIPSTVTRVVLVNKDGFTEKWAESWNLLVQDDGRTLKLFPQNPTGPRYEMTPGFFDYPPNK